MPEPSRPRGRVLVAVNPAAGRRRSSEAAALVGEVIAGDGLQVEQCRAADAARLRGRLIDELGPAADAVRALVVVGGDGMVNLGAGLVAGTPIPLGVVATGTGNDNAREFGLPVENPAAAARVVRDALSTGVCRALDAARWRSADGSNGWFCGVLGAGFDAIVNERANGWSWPRGRLRYDLAIVRELPVFRPREYTLDLDGRRLRTRAVLVAAGNGPAYGGGLRMCDGASMTDGLLDVVVAGPISRLALLRLYPSVWSGRHLDHPAVTRHRVRRVSIDAEGIVAYADGERLGPLPLTCEVVPGALRLLG